MGTVRQLATTIEEGLQAALPTLRKTVVRKLALAVGALLEAQTPNTVELANVLPLETERQDMREQWLRRLLKNPLLSSTDVLEPWARQALAAAGAQGQTIILSLDQTDVGDRFAILMISLGGVIGRYLWRGRWKQVPRIWALRPQKSCWSGYGRGSRTGRRCCCRRIASIPRWRYCLGCTRNPVGITGYGGKGI